jgi:transcription initiation factor IIE alpha subunit
MADDSGEVYRTDDELAAALGFSVRQIQRAVRELREKKLATRVRLGKKQLTFLRPL